MFEFVKLDESGEEGEDRSEEEEAAERLDRLSILDAISQCDAFRHTIRWTSLEVVLPVGFYKLISHKT